MEMRGKALRRHLTNHGKMCWLRETHTKREAPEPQQRDTLAFKVVQDEGCPC